MVVHGDPDSLAGWGLAHESFTEAGNDGEAYRVVPGFGGADVIASTHTCLPVLWSGLVGEKSDVVVVANNGSAGMGNLQSGSARADYPHRLWRAPWLSRLPVLSGRA